MNEDLMTGTLVYVGHFCGCGFCGAVSEAGGDFPDCCSRMAEWKRAFAAVLDVAPEEPDSLSHEDLRWARVVRRLQAKRP